MKYRIKKVNDSYYPQYRFMYFWWLDFTEFMGMYTQSISFETHEEARKYILRKKYPDFNEVEYLEVLDRPNSINFIMND